VDRDGAMIPDRVIVGEKLLEETKRLNLHDGKEAKDTPQASNKRRATDERTLASGRRVVISSAIGIVRTSQGDKPPSKPCNFCEREGHWSNGCPTYTTHSLREARASELGYCIRCMNKGHGANMGDCDWRTLDKKCHHCGKPGHHQLLCPREFPDDEVLD
jgi:hypothetical protein